MCVKADPRASVETGDAERVSRDEDAFPFRIAERVFVKTNPTPLSRLRRTAPARQDDDDDDDDVESLLRITLESPPVRCAAFADAKRCAAAGIPAVQSKRCRKTRAEKEKKTRPGCRTLPRNFLTERLLRRRAADFFLRRQKHAKRVHSRALR